MQRMSRDGNSRRACTVQRAPHAGRRSTGQRFAVAPPTRSASAAASNSDRHAKRARYRNAHNVARTSTLLRADAQVCDPEKGWPGHLLTVGSGRMCRHLFYQKRDGVPLTLQTAHRADRASSRRCRAPGPMTAFARAARRCTAPGAWRARRRDALYARPGSIWRVCVPLQARCCVGDRRPRGTGLTLLFFSLPAQPRRPTRLRTPNDAILAMHARHAPRALRANMCPHRAPPTPTQFARLAPPRMAPAACRATPPGASASMPTTSSPP
jgi:hypothetical protein